MAVTKRCPPGRAGHFCTGDIKRHVIVMAGTGTVGLMAVFLVDLLNFYYISWLGDSALTAAIGFAGAVGYLQIAVSIGMTIGLGAVLGRMLGERKMEEARLTASSFMIVSFVMNAALGCATALFAGPVLHLFGATGESLTQAQTFLRIVSPALPLTGLGMGFSALMRITGDASRSMRVTLAGAFVSACFDPLLIFGLHEGLMGAALSTILSRGVVAVLGYRGALPHGLLCWPGWRQILPRARPVSQVAMPAILTNLATPAGGAYVTNAMAAFGSNAVSGQATVERIVPVVFAFIFALTGSVGPIMSQNLGAGQVLRTRQTLTFSLWLVAACVGSSWVILALCHDFVLTLFSLKGAGAAIVRMFCCWTVGSYLFVGILFVANAAFNNLGRPLYSTLFNWGRATLGTVPFVWLGLGYGPLGVLIGQAAGAILFGSGAIAVAFRVVADLEPGLVAPGVAIEIPGRTAAGAMVELEELD